MSKLECPKCGNKDGWKDVTMSSEGNKATCFVCGTEVKSDRGIEVGTVYGGMTFNIPRKNR